jgi:hypothetical protein
VVIGGSPVQQYQYPNGYPVQGYVSQPRPKAPAQNRAVKPVVRMQAPEETTLATVARQVPLEMPAPEQVGLGKPRAVPVDWEEVRKRMGRLHVTSFHSQRIPGGFRFICVVPGERNRQVEAEAVNEADAIDRALTQAETTR